MFKVGGLVAVHLCRVDLFYRLEADLSEVRSYMLGEDGRTITLMMRDGTRHNTLVFIGIFVRCVYYCSRSAML
jgi:hypothetical protein